MRNNNFCNILIIILIQIIFFGCKKNEEVQKEIGPVPIVGTYDISFISQNFSRSGGYIISSGISSITEKGVCWSTNAIPTISTNRTIDGTDTSNFTSYINGLNPNTTYYLRAYATNINGTGYGSTMVFKTLNYVTDADGNKYHSVIIGTQEWMIENLKTSKYNDSSLIPWVVDDNLWSNTYYGARCYNNNDSITYSENYGALYNYFAINTGKLAPIGWHVSTDNDWTILTNYLINKGYGYMASSNAIAKAIASKSHWTNSTTPGAPGNDTINNNASEFAAVPGGYRTFTGGYYSVGIWSYWWAVFPGAQMMSTLRYMGGNEIVVISNSSDMRCGFSVRCVKNL